MFPENAEELRLKWENNLSLRNSSGSEFRIIRPDGKLLWVTGNAVPEWLSNEFIGYIGTITDITERKLAEKKIEKIGKHYKTLIDKSPAGIVLVNAEGNFNYVSPTARKIFGYSETEEINENPADFTHPEDLHFVISEIEKIIENPSYIPTIQYRFVDKKGEYLWVESTFRNLYSDKDVEAIVINFQDITERKNAENALSSRNKEMALLNKIAIELTCIKNNNELFKYITTSLKKLTNAVITTFTLYNPKKKQIEIKNFEFENLNIQNSIEFITKRILKQNTYSISNYHLQDMIQNQIKMNLTLSAATFGMVSPRVGKFVQKVLGIESFIGITYSVGRELYGTSIIGLPFGQTIHSHEMLHTFTNMVAVSLKRNRAEEELIESEEKYRLLFENANEAIYIVQSLKLVFTNPACEQVSGLSKKELSGYSILNFVDTKDKENLSNHHNDLVKGITQNHNSYFTINNKIGEKRHLSVNSGRINWNGFPASLNFATDITERKLAEEEITAQKNELAAIFESSHQIICLVDYDGVIHKINKHGSKILGKKENELLTCFCGKAFNCVNSTHGDGCGKNEICQECVVRSTINQTYKTGEPILNKEGVLNCGDGKFEHKFYYLVSSSLVVQKDSNKVLMTIVDISKTKQAEIEIKNANNRLKVHLENSGDLLFVLDSDYRYLDYFGIETKDLFVPPDFFIGKKLNEIGLPEELCNKFSEKLKTSFDEKQKNKLAIFNKNTKW